jgi:CDP-Glycerol:Poly(glycerophosphate) glycerophosphotransferase
MKHQTKLDLIDRLTHLIAKSAIAEQAARSLIDARKSLTFTAWRVINRAMTLAGYDRTDAINAVLVGSEFGANDLLLMTDSFMRFPQLITVAGELADLPGAKEAVTIVVADLKAEVLIRPSSKPAKIINLQRFWLDHKHDLANHDAAHQVLSIFRQASAEAGAMADAANTGARPANARGVALFNAMAMNLHTSIIGGLRMAGALRAARDEGARMIVVAVDGDSRFYAGCYETLLRGANRPLIALSQHGFLERMKFDKVDPRFDMKAYVTVARRHLNRYLHDTETATPATASTTVTPASVAPPNGPSVRTRDIMLVTDALPGSIYWNAVANIADTAKREGKIVHAVVSRKTAAKALRGECATVMIAKPSIGVSSGGDFVASYNHVLDVVAKVAAMPRDGMSELTSLGLDLAIARLTAPTSIDGMGWRAFRQHDDMMRRLQDSKVSAVVVLPHWSVLGWAALSSAPTLGLPTGSSPVVTISGTNASIVEWHGLSMIGCYGTQCAQAFKALGYPDEKFELVGNVTLDQAVSATRETARRANRTFRKLSAKGRRLILFATSGVNKNEADVLQAIMAMCNDPAANATLIVRPHPTIGRQSYADVLARSSAGTASIVSEGTVQQAISAADVVITDFSTVGAEAVLLTRPLLVINCTGAPFPANNYAALGVAAEANAVDQVVPQLRRLLAEGNYWPDAASHLRQFIDAYNWGNDGKASSRFLARLAERIEPRGDRAPQLAPAAIVAEPVAAAPANAA